MTAGGSAMARPARPPPTLDTLPHELIMDILYRVPSVDLARSVQRLNRRCHHLSNEPKLWLARCRSDFAYWTSEHRGQLAAAGRANRGSWKQMWLERMRSDARSSRHFEAVLASKVHRIRHLEEICRCGLDAKDYLLAQLHCPDDAEDVLARRYYAHSALASINRSLAIEEWWRVRQALSGLGGLDRALSAFDMFVLGEGREDMDAVQRELDRRAAQFRATQRGLEHMTTRQKAVALARWVREMRLAGMPVPDVNYRNVRNCLLGHALLEAEHSSLPIVSSAIYACIAQRLGLHAYCVAVPGHVHNTVLAPTGETVDDTPLSATATARRLTVHERLAQAQTQTGTASRAGRLSLPLTLPDATTQPSLVDNGDRLFLNPFDHGREVPLRELRETISSMDWGAMLDAKDAFLMPAPTSALVLRVALNLEASWTQAQRLTQAAQGTRLAQATRWLRHGDPDMNMDALLYAAQWASLLMRPVDSVGWERHLEGLATRFAHYFGEDAWIVDTYLVPLYDEHRQRQQPARRRELPGPRDLQNPRVLVKMVRNLDQRQPLVSRRYRQDIQERVLYRVGQVFRHRRFGFVGIINGWSPDDPKLLPQAEHGDDEGTTTTSPPLSPEARAYYTCLRPGADRQVVAQKNVELVTDPAEIPDGLFFLAGRHFKRFDHDTCSFVSNIREFFPDD